MSCQLKLSSSGSCSLEAEVEPVEEPELSDGDDQHITPGEVESSSSVNHRRRTVSSWHSFGQPKWQQIYPWIAIKEDDQFFYKTIYWYLS